MEQMVMSNPIGVLLINLGTPDSYRSWDVFRYLNEFLTDARVIDLPWLKRQLLSRGIIVPFRFRQSAKLYKHLWTKEGSPLLVHGRAVQSKLQESLGQDYKVVLAMRYQQPSIQAGLAELKEANVKEIIIFPLFPQYASATTGSVHQKVMDFVRQWDFIPKLTFINSYADHPEFIKAFCDRGKEYSIQGYDHILFSFHGLPERHLNKADPCNHCLTPNCCQLASENTFCYKAQCYKTANGIATRLNIQNYTICFQSRLGKDPWIQPYTLDMIKECASKGYKKVLVFCPAFVCDCLETTCEITEEYGLEFKKLGGEKLQLVEGLNSHPSWINGLKTIVQENCSSK